VIERIIRAGLLACVGSLVGVVASASFGNPPTVSGLSAWITSPGQPIVINGNHFSNDFSSDCSLSGAPTVNFEGLDGHTISGIRPASTGSQDCTNSSVKVTVPSGFSSGARIRVIDSSGQQSNDNWELTLQPAASLTPTSGQVGTSVTVNGSNLHPLTLAPSAQLHLTYPGVNITINSPSPGWGNQLPAFSPGNTSGAAQVTFPVSIDANNPSVNVQVVTVPAGSFTFLPPSVSTTAITSKVVGDQIVINGANLGSGGSVTFPGGPVGQGQSWSSSQVTVSVPPGAQNGNLTLHVNGYGPSVTGPSIAINPLVKTMTPSSGSAGTAVTLAGYNFGTTQGKVTAGGISQTVSSWGDQGIAFTLSGDTDSGAVAITRSDGVVAAAPNLTIVPRLDKIETNNVKAGAAIVIDGVSLGANTGTAKIGSTTATSQLWSRTSVLLTVPASLAPGAYPVVLTTAGGAASNALNLTVVPGPAAASPGAPGSSAATHTNPSQFIDNNHQFHKPPKTDSPVQLALTVAKHQLRAGGTSDLTVVLTLNGKPVNGAEVNLRMLYTPGSDFKFMPASGTTDANGTFTAQVQISKVNGDTIVEADSGIFSDQDHILGTGGAAPLATINPANTGGIVPLAGLGVLAMLMVGVGVWLNLRSSRPTRA
jgi:hypothetical protein